MNPPREEKSRLNPKSQATLARLDFHDQESFFILPICVIAKTRQPWVLRHTFSSVCFTVSCAIRQMASYFRCSWTIGASRECENRDAQMARFEGCLSLLFPQIILTPLSLSSLPSSCTQACTHTLTQMMIHPPRCPRPLSSPPSSLNHQKAGWVG